MTSRKHFVESIFRFCNAKFQSANEAECLLMLYSHLAIDVTIVICNSLCVADMFATSNMFTGRAEDDSYQFQGINWFEVAAFDCLF